MYCLFSCEPWWLCVQPFGPYPIWKYYIMRHCVLLKPSGEYCCFHFGGWRGPGCSLELYFMPGQMGSVRGAVGTCFVRPSPGGPSGIRAEVRRLQALSFRSAAWVRSTWAQVRGEPGSSRTVLWGCFLKLFLIHCLPNPSWFPGSPVFCLAVNCLFPQLSCLGPTLGEQRGKEFGLQPPFAGCCCGCHHGHLGQRELRGRKGSTWGGSSVLSELFGVSFPIPHARLHWEVSLLPHGTLTSGVWISWVQLGYPGRKEVVNPPPWWWGFEISVLLGLLATCRAVCSVQVLWLRSEAEKGGHVSSHAYPELEPPIDI